MADRVRLPDFKIFVSTVGLSYQSGGNLALLLDRLAVAARDRIQFLGYFRAATALGRTAGIVLGLAMPVLVIAYGVLGAGLRHRPLPNARRSATIGYRRRLGSHRHRLVFLSAASRLLRRRNSRSSAHDA